LVDQATEVLPFAQVLQQVAPMWRGPGFDQVWPHIEDSLGIERLTEPTRAMVMETHTIRPEVVLGYWDQVLTTDPPELQAWIDNVVSNIRCPCLAVFGRPVTDGERERLQRLPDVQIEEWVGDGHFVHLVEPELSRPNYARSSRTASERVDRAEVVDRSVW
jgi:pimeloyl-ACP methyl ester carboxylesterase